MISFISSTLLKEEPCTGMLKHDIKITPDDLRNL